MDKDTFIKLNDYWTYIPLKGVNNHNIIMAFFNLEGYMDKVFIYTNKVIKDNEIPQCLIKSKKEISSTVELMDLLSNFSDEEKTYYHETLIDCGFYDNYILYSFDFNKENIDNLINFFSAKLDSDKKLKKGKSMKKYMAVDNSNQLTFYVILRNDLNISVPMQMVYVTEITKAIQEDLRVKAIENSKYANYYNKFSELQGNTVILQASGKELFEENFIPIEYNNKDITFNYIWDDEEKVAPGNFKLKDGNIVCLGYFGVKKDLPHFVRTLKLYGGK